MAVWRLTPIDPHDPNWAASSHRAHAIVRAPDEARAREAAQKAFGIKTRFEPGVAAKAAPWSRTDLTKAEEIEDVSYPSEGPTEVLEPAFD